jgi:hypothetical protein
LVGSFLQAQQVHQDAIMANALGVGQPSAATGQGENQLGDVGGGSKTHALALTRIQGRFPLEPLP